MRFQGLDLNHLIALEVLLIERNLTQAARRLHMTQPSVSNLLNRLREHFQDRLLSRRGRAMERTAFADKLLKPLQASLEQIRGVALARPRFDPQSETRAFRVLLSDYIATVLLSDLVLHLASCAPHVVIEPLSLSDESLGRFARGEADVLICPEGRGAVAGLPRRHLFTENFVCIARRGNRGVGTSLDPADLYRRPRVVPPYRIYLPEMAFEHVEEIPALTMPFSAIPWFVARSNHVAIVPERLAKLFLPHLPLRRVALTKPIQSVSFIAVCHPSTMTDTFKLWVLDQLEEVARGATSRRGRSPRR
jgi:LysR family nod box-dependent transcriptional activator